MDSISSTSYANRPGTYELNAKEFGPVVANTIGVAQSVGNAASATVSFSDKALSALGKEITSAANGVEDFFSGAADYLEDAGKSVVNTAEKAVDYVEDAASSVKNTVTSAADSVVDAVESGVDGVESALGKVADGIASVTDTVGSYVGLGVASATNALKSLA